MNRLTIRCSISVRDGAAPCWGCFWKPCSSRPIRTSSSLRLSTTLSTRATVSTAGLPQATSASIASSATVHRLRYTFTPYLSIIVISCQFLLFVLLFSPGVEKRSTKKKELYIIQRKNSHERLLWNLDAPNHFHALFAFF